MQEWKIKKLKVNSFINQWLSFRKKTHKYHTYVIHKDYNINHFENLIWTTLEELDEHNKKSPIINRGRKPRQKKYRNCKCNYNWSLTK